MTLKTYNNDTGPEKLRVEVVHSLAECEGHKLAASFVPVFSTLLEEWKVVYDKCLTHLDSIARAEGRINGCDSEIDIFVDNVSATLLLLHNNDRSADEYQQYFGSQQPNEIKRPVLNDELETVRGWIGPLKASSNALLKELGARGEGLVKSADAAVEALGSAEQAYRVFRFTGEYSQFVDKLNATRKSVYGELDKLPHQPDGKNLPGDFAARFFRHEKRRHKKVTIDSVRKQITELEDQLAALQATLADLESKEAARQKEEAEREKLLAAYEEAEKARAAAEKKAAELRAKLRK